jgi:hypothetical protein
MTLPTTIGFSLTGYVVEPPRVGTSNSPFTLTPYVFISDGVAYATAYPTSEANPRTDYLVLVQADGKLPAATFGWTKNEGLTATGPAVQRFDYDGRKQSFLPMKGAAPTLVGTLTSTANTTRLKVATTIGVLASAPFRLSIGATGSATSLATSLVPAFGSPSAGTVEILTLGSNAGQLNWNPADLVTYEGEPVRFQRQSYFTAKESNGKLGLLANGSLLLNPIPGTGQKPLVRIGFGTWLLTVERANEGAFSSDPATGSVEWAATTGMLKFHAADIAANAGHVVYYDGTLLGHDLVLPRQSLGTINTAANTSPQASTFAVPAPGADIIFRTTSVQFPEAVLVTTLDPVGKQGQVQYTAAGQIQISLADRIALAGQGLEGVVADLPLEHGLSMRFFRTPVDLAGTDSTLKDVSAVYNVTDATWAEPVIASPQVFLPSIPIDGSLTVRVKQGTGSFLGTLPRLDVPSAPDGFGYVIDYDAATFQYANRHNDLLVPLIQAAAIAVLPDPLVVDAQTAFALETSPGSGTYTPLVRDEDFLLDPTAGQVYFATTFGDRKAFGTGTSTGTTFTDAGANFTSTVTPGDQLVASNSGAKGVYTVVAVSPTALTTDVAATSATNVQYEVRSGKEVLADRFFQEVSIVDPNTKVERIRTLPALTNSPRLNVPAARVGATRFLFADGAATTSVVANDASFTNPSSLAAGTIQVSTETGNLNFSAADLVRTAKWVFLLVQGKDYRISSTLGFIEFTERMLTGEEGLVTYTTPNTPDVVVEPITFLVRKEQVQPHPAPVSTVTFNPDHHRLALNPPPRVFRGGRPQVTNEQVTINAAQSSVTFLADAQLTDALPHGSVIAPIERILVDYYIYDALGGEKTTTVLQPPINLARVIISQGATSFVITGNWTASFSANHLLRIENDQVYLIGSATYDGATALTTITLAGGQKFQDDFVDPRLYVTSGLTRTSAAAFAPSYFGTEMSAYETVPRGMNVVKIAGDRTLSYKSNTVVLFTDGTFIDTYRVSGARYDAETARTEVSLTTNVRRQYGAVTLKHSVRPIVDATTTSVSTVLNPILTFPDDPTTPQYTVYRRVEGQVGTLLSSPADYTIDATGTVKVSTPLRPNEEISILYTGLRTVPAGLRLKASYTHLAVPNATNGLLNQVLVADYSTFSPDSFYFRVETMTNFRGEMAKDLESQAKSSAPGGGPQTSNSSSPQLNQQGRESLFFQEGHLGNQDLVARSILKFYNDAINSLEDGLHLLDGRMVGDRSGRFKFDGRIDNPVRMTPSAITNHIDDRLQVSPLPAPDGTVQKVYLPGPYSRFFTTQRNLFAGPALTGTNDGDVLARFAFNKLTSLPGDTRRRAPRAQILKDYPAGALTFEVDNVLGTTDALLRPAFVTNMRVVIQDAAGVFYVNDAQQVTISAVSDGPPHTLTLTAGSSTPVPAGATIYLSPSDASTTLSDSAQSGYAMVYQFGKDLNANLDTGELLFRKRAFPFDGTLPTLFIPKIFLINEVQPGDILQVTGAGVSPLNVAPYKFPALYGGTTDDDGDQAVPLIGPTLDGELTSVGGGPLNVETGLIGTPSGTLRAITTAPYVGTGTLDGALTTITDTTAYVGTVPQVGDLARILTGTNGATDFRRVTAVGASSITVATPFAFADSGFSYTVAIGVGSTYTASWVSTDVFASAGDFFADNVRVGDTVIVFNGPFVERRQVASVVSALHLTVTTAFTVDHPAPTASARISNALDTFSGPEAASEVNALAVETAATLAEVAAIQQFLLDVFTTVTSGTTGLVSAGSLTVLTDSSATFLTAGVTASDVVYVPAGPSLGVYQIASVDSNSQLTVTTPFPGADTPVSYLVVSAFGAGLPTFQNLIEIIKQNETFRTSTQAFQTLWNTPVPVVGDASAFARGYSTADLNARAVIVAARIAYLTDPALGPLARIQNALSGTERLYDKRYTWIDARINMEKGLLVKQTRAIENRIKAQADTLNQLIKLLAVKQ